MTSRQLPRPRRTYLGMPLPVALAVAAIAAAIGAAISIAIPASCDDGAPCISEDEYADVLATLDTIRTERSGGRFATDVLAECAKTNGADLTVSACVDYLAEQAFLADTCGAIAEQLAYEACEDAALPFYRSARR